MPDPVIVISNTTPLLYLHQIGMAHLLERLYGKVIITQQVVEELRSGGAYCPNLDEITWLEVRDILIPTALKLVPDLGAGEASTLALAMEVGNEPLLLLDDRLARRIASLYGLRYTGTAGVLMRSKEEGLIQVIRPLLEKLIQAGFYLRPAHLKDICALVGET